MMPCRWFGFGKSILQSVPEKNVTQKSQEFQALGLDLTVTLRSARNFSLLSIRVDR
jgi:hypothetical protein